MTLGPGDTLAGRYELMRMIGGGPAGRVYVAYDRHLEREVALRFVMGDADASETLLDEGRRMSALSGHSREAVAVLDAGRTDDDGAFTATELVDGTPLEEVARHRAPVPAREAVAVAIQLLDACLAVQRHQGGRADTVVASALQSPDGRVRVTRFQQSGPGPGGADPACPAVARTLDALLAGSTPPAHLRRTIDDGLAGRIPTADGMRARLLSGPAPGAGTPTAVLPPPPPSDPPPGRRWPWVVGAIVALLVIAGAFLLIRGGGGDTTPIPDVAGRTSADAVAALRAAGFAPRTAGRVDATVARGIVISTSPPAGEEAEEGSEVIVAVSQGTGSVAVPALAGLTRDAAAAALDDAGLEARYLQAASASVPEGSVVSQDPAAGLQIPVGSVVAVTLSTGPPMVDVPDLVGGTVEDASVALRTAGLTLGVVRQGPAGGASPGTVVAQDPAAGDEAVEGTAVDVTVAEAGAETGGG